MDIDTLGLVLDDNKTYQDVSKELFLQKVKEGFDDFKKYGDTELLIYPGRCISTKCSNSGKRGYSFIGGTSKLHLDMIFEETDTEFVVLAP